MKLPQELDAFELDFIESLKVLEEKYKVKVSLGTLTYSPEHFTVKLTAKNTVRADGLNIEEAEFRKHCKKFGFTNEHFNANLILNNKPFRFIEINPRATKKPCKIISPDGTRYACGPAVITAGIRNYNNK